MKKYDIIFSDLDGTLINTISGETSPKGIWDMQIRFEVLDKIKELNPKYVFIISNQGGIESGFINEKHLKNTIKKYLADPLKDSRCSGCVHVDGPICPYPDYCESMKPTPTCYNCKFSYYGAGPEGCDLHGDIILLNNDTCPDYKPYKDK